MPANVKVGQKWSVWLPTRRQWLLSTVVGRDDGKATLKYDVRYGLEAGCDEDRVEETTMLAASNRFRFLAP